ncbi:hypothetical protein N8137_05170 [Porticoccaceae bacterium]|nr:hypothetical protein [Porticoccaceae bacterium]
MNNPIRECLSSEDRQQAMVMAKIASGTSIAAAETFSVVGGNREQTIDSEVQFILGGLETFKK